MAKFIRRPIEDRQPGETCPGCQTVEIHMPIAPDTNYMTQDYAYALKRCQIKQLERRARAEVRMGVDIDVDHPFMIDYRRIIKEHWNG